jgi:hypothetical protein
MSEARSEAEFKFGFDGFWSAVAVGLQLRIKKNQFFGIVSFYFISSII